MEKEIRTLQLNVRDLQENPQSRHIEGYAVVFNSESVDLGGFREVILPTAITQGLIERSDVFMVFQHDMDKVLARSRNGQGSLQLTLDDHGLRFAFDAPNTDLGNEVLEYLRRSDVSECSFAFALDPNDNEADVWEKREDGSILRTINRIAGLYDCAIVWNAAYPETSVSARSLEKIEELRADEKPEDEEKPVEGEDTPNEDNTSSEENPTSSEEEPTPNEGEEKPAEDTPAEDTPNEGEDTPNEDTPAAESPNPEEDLPEDDEEKRNKYQTETISFEKKNKQTHTHNIMEKKFSLLKSIRDIANGQPLSPENQAVCDLGKQEMRGLTANGQIQLPIESRDAVTVTAEGEDVVVTDFMDILAPLHSKNVLAECGAKILTGLVGDVQIPTMSAGQVGWKGEIVSADELNSTFDHETLSPKRLTAYVDISKQFLVQDSLNAEQMLREELVNAMVQKLEDTIFGTAAGDATKPAGIFNGMTATSVTNFAGIANLEATVENANFLGEMKYILSPNAKAALRAMGYQNKSTRQVFENDSVDGVPALTTTHIANPTFAYGDWSNLVVGQFGSLDITVDPYSVAKDGKVRIVLNAFFDAKMTRDGAIAYGTIGQ